MRNFETREVFTSAMNDVITDVRSKSDENLLEITESIVDEYEEDKAVSLDKLAEKYNVAEINIVSSDGAIIASTNEDVVGVLIWTAPSSRRSLWC